VLPVGRDEVGLLGRQLERTAVLLAERDQALRRAHRALDRFFALSLDLFCVARFDGYFKRLNPAWRDTLGWSDDELCARPFLDFVHPDDRESTSREAGKLAEGSVTVQFENRYRCHDGSYRWLQWMAVPVLEDAQIYAIARDVTNSKAAEAEVLALNADLAHRSAELSALNRELEAFSYSVSHDLRAPLRSIDGFSQVLLEDYADKLDDEGKDSLQRVRAAATRMAALIDALLALSRVTRAELRAERVDLSALAQSIAADLRQGEPDRHAEFLIESGMVAEGDPRLLRAALENLLGNAWKFTRRTAAARIEFGSLRRADETVYRVRDNGVGFDMTYAGKLFGAFQRLHEERQFSGTGVGLATVQRIMHRHGGRVWAEGAVERGATFYFTLNDLSVGNSSTPQHEIDLVPALPSRRDAP
jgi:PAS domain S-box-containing protein